MKQTCNKCKIEKEVTDFYKNKRTKSGLQNNCKSCQQEYKNQNKEKSKKHQEKYRQNNKAKTKVRSKKYYKENKDIILKKCRKYQSKNKESILKNKKKYREINLKKVREKANKYLKNKRDRDPLFKLKGNLRNRVYSILKNEKDKSTEELLGAPFTVVKEYLTSTFTEGMTWENYGEWHIDHKIPLASAKTKEEVIKLFHYTNLQALWEFDNLSKGDSY